MANDVPSTDLFVEAVGAEVTGKKAHFESVSTDSRMRGDNALFVAIRGANTDGHLYIDDAYKNGARVFLVSKEWISGKSELRADATYIVVASPLEALQKTAEYWCALVSGPRDERGGKTLVRIGVTGSSGKTTCKEIIASILSARFSVIKNPGNLNSDIGLASSLFLVRPSHEFAVFEMGINRVGEMRLLASMFRPDIAVITLIGSAHIGMLGGTKAHIAKEKKDISSFFPQGGGTLVFWEDDEFRDYLAEGMANACTFGPRSLPDFSGARDLGIDGWQIQYAGREIPFPLPGAHNLLNALAGIRVAELLGVDPSGVDEGLRSVEGVKSRTTVYKGKWVIVDDTYNANLESFRAGLAFGSSLARESRLLCVLGAMKELGEKSPELHEQLGALVAREAPAYAFCVGEDMQFAVDKARELGYDRIRLFASSEDLVAAVCAFANNQDCIYIKGSRALALDKVALALKERMEQNDT